MYSSYDKSIKVIILCLLSLQLTAQHSNSDSIQIKDHKAGGELKGLYIGGSMALAGGVAMGVAINGFSDYPRSGLPIISGTIAVAPISILGLGIGSLLTKNHSSFEGSFQLGVGIAYSSPIFSEFVPGNAHRAGINVQLLSPELGPWRYSLSFSQFFPEDYDFEEIESYRGRTNLSWWEMNLDLQYLLINLDQLIIYPFIGTQYNSIHSEGNKLNSEILANYGIGVNVRISGKFQLYSDMRFTIDPDDNPGNMSMSVGLLYKL